MENGTEVPQKIKNRIAIWSSNFTFGYLLKENKNTNLKRYMGASLVVQWLRTRLPTQGTRVRALVREDPTCHRASKPVRHNYWACALEPASHDYRAHVPQLLKPMCLEPVLCNKKPPQWGAHAPQLGRKPVRSNEDPTQPMMMMIIIIIN